MLPQAMNIGLKHFLALLCCSYLCEALYLSHNRLHPWYKEETPVSGWAGYSTACCFIKWEGLIYNGLSAQPSKSLAFIYT